MLENETTGKLRVTDSPVCSGPTTSKSMVLSCSATATTTRRHDGRGYDMTRAEVAIILTSKRGSFLNFSFILLPATFRHRQIAQWLLHEERQLQDEVQYCKSQNETKRGLHC